MPGNRFPTLTPSNSDFPTLQTLILLRDSTRGGGLIAYHECRIALVHQNSLYADGGQRTALTLDDPCREGDEGGVLMCIRRASYVTLIAASAVVAACTGENGVDGADGQNSLVRVETEPPGVSARAV